ncbi:MAG: hypothetical protein PHD65_06780 [Gallionella sp.]|nr:hypothetical protein [Gallionella sp.]
MFRPAVNFSWVILIVALCGCASTPDTRSVRHKQAMEWAHQGEKAYLNGNVEQSRQHYERALQLNTSIENAHGIAANTLSLAQINLERGEYDQAEAKLQFILGDKAHLFAPDSKAEAAARSAQLALLLKQPDKAGALAQQAQSLCETSQCAIEATILNLRAQAAFALGEFPKSADLAQQAGATAEKQKQLVELANAWRLLAEIRLRQGAAADTVALLEKVLPLDKQLGLPKKIVADLRLMAEARDKLGQHEEAESCRSRERAIRLALGEKLP